MQTRTLFATVFATLAVAQSFAAGHYHMSVSGQYNAIDGTWSGDLATKRQKLHRGGSVTVIVDNLLKAPYQYKLRVKGGTSESSPVGQGAAPKVKPLELDDTLELAYTQRREDEWTNKVAKPFNDKLAELNAALASYDGAKIDAALNALKAEQQPLEDILKTGASTAKAATNAIEKAVESVAATIKAAESAASAAKRGQTTSTLALALDADATVELVRITPKAGETPEKLEVIRSFFVQVAREGGPRLSLSAGANLLLGPAQKTYLSVPALDSLGNQLTDNGRPLFTVTRDTGTAHPGGSLQVSYHHVFNEESYDDFRTLIGLLTLGQYKPGYNRIGFTALLSSDLTSNPAFGFGPSLFLDRDATLALSYGIYFRNVQRLSGGLGVGSLTTLTEPTTIADFRSGFFVGFSWGISAGGEKKK